MQSIPKPERDLSLGEIVGDRYRIDALIGMGGYGRVYRGTQLSIDRAVAIKVVDPGDRDAVSRFRREAELVKQLEHPNTVRVFDVGTSAAGVPFVVMEYLRGSSVHQMLNERGKLPPRTALEIASQVLAALAEAHQKGIVHRDIKPENVFVTSHVGQPTFVKVLDFGIAKRQRSTETVLTAHGEAPGTPNYMAPEQILGMEADARTDVYAVGLLLAEMLTGKTVFDSGGARTLMQAHLQQVPAPLDPVLDVLPGGAVVRRAVEKMPSRRYASAPEMITAIEGEIARIDQVARGYAEAARPTRPGDARAMMALQPTHAQQAQVPQAPRAQAPRAQAPQPQAPQPQAPQAGGTLRSPAARPIPQPSPSAPSVDQTATVPLVAPLSPALPFVTATVTRRERGGASKGVVLGLVGAVIALLVVAAVLFTVLWVRERDADVRSDRERERKRERITEGEDEREQEDVPSAVAPPELPPLDPPVRKALTTSPQKIRDLLKGRGYVVWTDITDGDYGGMTLNEPSCTGGITILDAQSREGVRRVVEGMRGNKGDALAEGSVVITVAMARLSSYGLDPACTQKVVDLLAAPR